MLLLFGSILRFNNVYFNSDLNVLSNVKTLPATLNCSHNWNETET